MAAGDHESERMTLSGTFIGPPRTADFLPFSSSVLGSCAMFFHARGLATANSGFGR